MGGRWAVKFPDYTAPIIPKDGGFYNDYVSLYLCCPVPAVVPDRRCGQLEEPVKEVGSMTRQDYINAITHLLEDADPEALRLIWIAARRLTRKKVHSNV